MAIHFELDGIKYTCDTAAEASELVVSLGKAPFKPPALGPTVPMVTATVNGNGHANGAAAPVWQVDATMLDFFATADEKGRKLMAAAADSAPRPVIAEDLVKQLGLTDLNEVGWVRRKLKNVAKESEIDLERFLLLVKVHVDGKPKTAYRATPRLSQLVKYCRESGADL